MPQRDMIFNVGDDGKQQRWPAFICDGVTYDLSHLDAHEVIFALKDDSYRFIVTYSHHCFAKDCPDGSNIDPKWIYPHGNERRAFHVERYALSKKLPSLMPGLITAKTYHAGYDNYAFCELIQGETVVYYKITFVIYRSAKKFRLHISSAYPVGANDYNSKRRVNFASIVNSVARGKKLPTPK